MSASARAPRAEAEVKIELTAAEFAQLPGILAALTFTPRPIARLRDYYLGYEPSSSGGFDFTRLRVKDDANYLLTQKAWTRDAQGHRVRLEEERTVSAAEAQALLATAHPLILGKERQKFTGRVRRRRAVVALDSLTLQGRRYFFLECEVMTSLAQAQRAREEVLAWMRRALPLREVREAMSMLELLKSVSG